GPQRTSESWQSLAQLLGAAGAGGAAGLAETAAGLPTTAASGSHGPFQPLLVPFLDGGAFRTMTLYWPGDSEGRAAVDHAAQRFALDLELSRLGALQLDGLVRPRRLDLVLRSRKALPLALRAEIAEAFRGSLAASGFAGEI